MSAHHGGLLQLQLRHGIVPAGRRSSGRFPPSSAILNGSLGGRSHVIRYGDEAPSAAVGMAPASGRPRRSARDADRGVADPQPRCDDTLMIWSVLLTVLGWCAWVGVTLGPIALAFGARRLAASVRPSWLIHLLPVLLAVEWLGIDFLFFATGDTRDGPPGLGFALLPSMFIVLLTFVFYYGALMLALFRRIFATR